VNRKSDPGRLSQLLRGELDWIVMKALEKDRNRRDETARALATDGQRSLENEPVHACPPSAWYRFRKMARRNRSALVTASAVTLALIVAVVALVVSVVRISGESRARFQALEEATEKEALANR